MMITAGTKRVKTSPSNTRQARIVIVDYFVFKMVFAKHLSNEGKNKVTRKKAHDMVTF